MKYLTCLAFVFFCGSIVFAKEPVTIYLAGDSTMATKLPEKRPETGWGEFLQDFFDQKKVKIENRAKNGRSTRTFIEEKLWDDIVSSLRKGDYVFIQFGHNDQSKTKVERYTSPDDYRRNLIRFINEVRNKKATPVLLTPVMRRRFDQDGNFRDSHGVYPDVVRAVAQEHEVALIDMHRLSERVLRDCGVDKSRDLFLHLAPNENSNYPNGVTDDTHFRPLGAETMAELVVEALRTQHLKLAKELVKSNARKFPPPCTGPSTVTSQVLVQFELTLNAFANSSSPAAHSPLKESVSLGLLQVGKEDLSPPMVRFSDLVISKIAQEGPS
ncbi:MAG TPA: rhamnogalacturonan acetylesterase [Pyrinomonadaceae bacterium]|nr:rhamnogalacturonan acetylesterase [Pyrinomonadaceae bacterium]